MIDAKEGPSRKSKRYDAKGNYINPEDRTGEWDDYEIRSALTTLVTAAKIRKNAALMKKVRAEARKQAKVAETTAKAV